MQPLHLIYVAATSVLVPGVSIPVQSHDHWFSPV